MNRKLLNGLLLLAVATGGVGTFTSCKDSTEDIKDELLLGQKTLAQQIQAIQDLTNSDFVGNLDKWLNTSIANCNGDINSLSELVLQASYMKSLYNTLISRANSLGTSTTDPGAAADAIIGYLLGQIEELQGKVNTNATAISDLDKRLADIEVYKEQIAQIQQIINDVADLKTQLAALQEEVDAISKKIDDELAAQMAELNARFANWVTGITVQQTANHIFGTLNIPVSIASNYLGGYYFQSDHAVSFPVLETMSYECNLPSFLPGTPSNIEYLAKSFNYTYAASEGPVFADFENSGNLGKLYLTVDPASVNYSNISVELVNSQGDAILSPMTLKPSDEVLSLGYTRADAPSLYEVAVNAEDAKATVEAIGVDLELDKDVLDTYKAALKNALYDPEAINIISLGKMLYEGLTADAPVAYGVRASWGEGDNANSVVSKYDIAVEAIRPLSYHSAYGFGTTRQLPTFNYSLQYYVDYLFDQLKGKVNVSASDGENDLSGTLANATITENEDGTITISLDGVTLKTDDGKEITLGSDAVITLDFSEGEFNAQDAVIAGLVFNVKELEKQLNDQSDLTGSVSSGLQAAQDKINELLSGKLSFANNLFDMYNALASKINEFLKDPNHFLQVMMAYEGNNGELYPLSTDWKAPTQFVFTKGDSDDEYISLYATSHTAELIVPAYKKYIAISNVLYPWNNASTPAQVSGLQNTQYGINYVNSTVNGANLNEVTSGRNQQVLIQPAEGNQYGLREGFVYEVVYSALDHRGYTSTQTYYFTVKYVEPEED